MRSPVRTTVLTVIMLGLLAAPLGAADPDVYMNTEPPPESDPGLPPGEQMSIDADRAVVASADADIYMREASGSDPGSAIDDAWLAAIEFLADVLAALGR